MRWLFSHPKKGHCTLNGRVKTTHWTPWKLRQQAARWATPWILVRTQVAVPVRESISVKSRLVILHQLCVGKCCKGCKLHRETQGNAMKSADLDQSESVWLGRRFTTAVQTDILEQLESGVSPNVGADVPFRMSSDFWPIMTQNLPPLFKFLRAGNTHTYIYI